MTLIKYTSVYRNAETDAIAVFRGKKAETERTFTMNRDAESPMETMEEQEWIRERVFELPYAMSPTEWRDWMKSDPEMVADAKAAIEGAGR